MDDPAIFGVAPERLIPEARRGNQEALYLLLFGDWLNQMLDEMSVRVARQFNFKVEAEELRFHVFEQVRLEIANIPPADNLTWPDRLTAWCYTVARNHGYNIIRHRGVEGRYWDVVSHAKTQVIRDGKRIAPPCSDAVSQEDEVMLKEQDALVPTIRRTTQKVYDSLTPRDAWLVSLWMGRMTFQKISDVTGTPLATVGNRVKVFQKATVKEVMKSACEGENVTQLLAAVNKHSEGIRELLASSLAETDLRGDGPRAYA